MKPKRTAWLPSFKPRHRKPITLAKCRYGAILIAACVLRCCSQSIRRVLAAVQASLEVARQRLALQLEQELSAREAGEKEIKSLKQELHTAREQVTRAASLTAAGPDLSMNSVQSY